MSDAKLFEKECWEALKRMHGMTLRDQGSCIVYEYLGQRRACPDIVGSYQEEPGRWRKGFVIDCKLYGHSRRIDREDVAKLRRDMDAVRQELVRQQCIGQEQQIKGIFVSTVSNIVEDHEPLQLITINYDGGLGNEWERKLQRQFRNRME